MKRYFAAVRPNSYLLVTIIEQNVYLAPFAYVHRFHVNEACSIILPMTKQTWLQAQTMLFSKIYGEA